MMAFAAARRTEAKTVVLKLLSATRKSDASEETLAFMVCNALLACSNSNYEDPSNGSRACVPSPIAAGAASHSAMSCISTYTEAAFRGHKTSLARALVAAAFSKETRQPSEPDAPATLGNEDTRIGAAFLKAAEGLFLALFPNSRLRRELRLRRVQRSQGVAGIQMARALLFDGIPA